MSGIKMECDYCGKVGEYPTDIRANLSGKAACVDVNACDVRYHRDEENERRRLLRLRARMMSVLIPDRWRSTVRAPIRAAERCPRHAGAHTMPGPAYTRNAGVVACWASIIRWDFIRADKKLRGSWLP